MRQRTSSVSKIRPSQEQRVTGLAASLNIKLKTLELKNTQFINNVISTMRVHQKTIDQKLQPSNPELFRGLRALSKAIDKDLQYLSHFKADSTPTAPSADLDSCLQSSQSDILSSLRGVKSPSFMQIKEVIEDSFASLSEERTESREIAEALNCKISVLEQQKQQLLQHSTVQSSKNRANTPSKRQSQNPTPPQQSAKIPKFIANRLKTKAPIQQENLQRKIRVLKNKMKYLMKGIQKFIEQTGQEELVSTAKESLSKKLTKVRGDETEMWSRSVSPSIVCLNTSEFRAQQLKQNEEQFNRELENHALDVSKAALESSIEASFRLMAEDSKVIVKRLDERSVSLDLLEKRVNSVVGRNRSLEEKLLDAQTTRVQLELQVQSLKERHIEIELYKNSQQRNLELNAEISLLKQALDEEAANSQQKEEIVRTLTGELSEIEAFIKQSCEKVQILEQEKTKLESEIEKKDSEIQEYIKKCQFLETDWVKEELKYKKSAQEAQEKLMKLQTESEQQLKKTEDRAEITQNTYEKLEHAYKILEKKHVSVLELLKESNDQKHSQLTIEKQKLTFEIKEQGKLLSLKESEIIEAKQKCEEIVEYNRKHSILLNSQSERLQTENNSMLERTHDLEEQLAHVRAQNRSIGDQLAQERENIAYIRSTHKDQIQKLARKVDKKERKIQVFKQWSKNSASISQQFENLEQSYEQLKEQNEAIIESKEFKIQQLQEKLETSNRNLTQLREIGLKFYHFYIEANILAETRHLSLSDANFQITHLQSSNLSRQTESQQDDQPMTLLSEDADTMHMWQEGLHEQQMTVLKHEQQIKYLKQYIRDLESQISISGSHNIQTKHLLQLVIKLLKLLPPLGEEAENIVKILATMLRLPQEVEESRKSLIGGKSRMLGLFKWNN